jgi:hypothetical protein
MWILLLILVGGQPNGGGMVTSSLSTVDFYDQPNCEAAVENVKKMPYVVGAMCVNRGEAPRAAVQAVPKTKAGTERTHSAQAPMKLN